MKQNVFYILIFIDSVENKMQFLMALKSISDKNACFNKQKIFLEHCWKVKLMINLYNDFLIYIPY